VIQEHYLNVLSGFFFNFSTSFTIPFNEEFDESSDSKRENRQMDENTTPRVNGPLLDNGINEYMVIARKSKEQ
jgi:hypothetical protein